MSEQMSLDPREWPEEIQTVRMVDQHGNFLGVCSRELFIDEWLMGQAVCDEIGAMFDQIGGTS